MKKTKIMATIGPASKDKVILEEMILSGMNVVRLNMKYCSLDFCKDIIYKIRNIDKNLNTNTSILMDLEGPNITIHKLVDGKAYLEKNDKIRIYMNEILGDKTKFSVSYSNLINEVKTNTIIKLSDGLVILNVLEKYDDSIMCEVINGGEIIDNTSVYVIGSKLNIPFITEKDKLDIKFACEEKVDYISLSHVSSVEDVLDINDLLIELSNDHLSIIPKIETAESLDEIDEIIKVSDGILIDRNTLSINIPIERIPTVQRSIINKCHLNGKISILSTEIKSSIQNEIVPSKAEVSDVASAIEFGIDAIMLSGETTIGIYPVSTISMMTKVISSSEEVTNYYELFDKAVRTEKQDITGTIAYSVVESSKKLDALSIVIPTMTGYTAKKISRFRPNCPILALTPNIDTAKSLGLYYGIYPILIEDTKSLDDILKLSKEEVIKRFNYEHGDKIIITGGYPFKEVKHTNFMKIEEL